MKISKHFSWVIGLVLALAGVLALTYMGRLRTPVEQKDAKETDARFVEIERIKETSETVKISGFGKIQPRVSVAIPAEIPGIISWRHEALETGGIIGSGQKIIEIDPDNYKIQMQRAEKAFDAAKLQLELVRSEIEGVKKNLEISAENLELSKRELDRFEKLEKSNATSRSQLDKIRSAYKNALAIMIRDENTLNQSMIRKSAAEVAVSQAEVSRAEARLNLKRTEIAAPFLCRVEARNIEVGEYVTPGKTIAQLYDPSTLEVHVPVSVSDLVWLLPESAMLEPGNLRELKSEAMVKFCVDDSLEEICWTGRISRLSGSIRDRNRTIDIVVELPNGSLSGSKLPIIKGLFVEVELMGRLLEGVFKIPRAFISRSNTVNIFDNGKLRVEKVEVLRSENEFAYITGSLKDDDAIVSTRLPEIFPGMSLTLMASQSKSLNDVQKESQN
ncbi:MAG: efflux RND transporter periplasmic adaptor subunit [Candidatus Rifleibacteriota bacterium]